MALGAQKGNVGHHMKVLRDGGLVKVVGTRQVRGGTEQYYQRAARRFSIADRAAAPTAAMLAAVAEEIVNAPQPPLLALKHVRLTALQAEQLTKTLMDLVSAAQDSGEQEPRYGLPVSLFQQASVEPQA